MKKTMAMLSGSSKPTTRTGHISDVDFEPQAPALQDDDPPDEQQELDHLDEQIEHQRPFMIPTSSGAVRDRLDMMMNKRLEERIRQLQMVRAQVQDIQLKNKRDQLAKQIEINKVVDKLRRTKDRLELVTEELRDERAEELMAPRETRSLSASLTAHIKRTGLMTHGNGDVYALSDERSADIRNLCSNDDGSYWGVGVARAPEDAVNIAPRTVFEAGPLELKRFHVRDWNNEFQNEVHHTVSRHFDKKYTALRKISDMQAHFIESANNLARIIIPELHVPYNAKSLKPTALPKRRKTVSEYDSNDVLKQHTYGPGEWEPVYTFNNIQLQIAMLSASFYDGEEAAAKAVANELKAHNFIARDAIEQSIHFPFSIMIDYMGHRVLASATLPGIADPRDLVDVNRRAKELYEKETPTDTDWDAAQEGIRVRAQRLAATLNLKTHTISFDNQKEDIPGAADAQIFVGKDRRNYIMSCMRMLPAQPPTYPLIEESGHLYKFFRQEMLQTSINPINADVFTAFCGLEAKRDNEDARNLFNTLLKNVIPNLSEFRGWSSQVASDFETALQCEHFCSVDSHADDDPNLPATIPLAMHRHGVNMRFLGLVGRHSKNPKVIKIVCGEMVSRCCKVVLRQLLRNLLKQGQSSHSHLVDCIVKIMNEMLTRKSEADVFWKETVANMMPKKFAGCGPLQGLFATWRGTCDLKFVVDRFGQMMNIQFKPDVVEMLRKRDAIVAADVVGFEPRVKTAHIVPLDCAMGVRLVCDSFTTTQERSKKEILLQARAELESCQKSMPSHPSVLAFCGDVCLMLSKHFQFFQARDILEEGEDFYRKALCVRPQWKEVLHRLGDIHCEQAKYTRVEETAQRLRVRAGTRYLQALCFEWELNYTIRQQKTHKLDHLLQLPRGDIAAVSLATDHFSQFAKIDFSGTPEVGAGGIRRSLGKKAVLMELNCNGCKHFKDGVLSYVASRSHRSLTSLDLGNCLALGTEGLFGLAKHCERLKVLKLDHSHGIEDTGLTEVIKHCTAVTDLSLRGLPRITNKSCLYIGKFVTNLTSLDLSDSSQVTGTIMNEVAQLCPEFRIGKVDGCYTVDDVPCITMGRCNTSLEEISLSGCVRITSLAVKGLSKCRKIHTINLSGCIRIDDMAINVMSEKHAFPQLQHLDLTSCDLLTSEALLTFLHVKPWLRALLLGKVTQISELVVKRIGKVCINLEELSLDSCVGVTKEAATLVANSCTKLLVLSLANCMLIEDSVISTISKRIKSLVKLDLSGCRQITSDSVSAVIKKNTGLVDLLLYGCPKLSNEVLETVGGVCPELKVFQISLSNHVSDHGVMKLVTGCPLLKELHITNCPAVSKDIKDLIRMQLPWIQFSSS